jgi:hypothetical protein
VNVRITTREERGLVPYKKSYFLDCVVHFSEEEKAIIRARGLSQHFFVVGSETPPPSSSLRMLSLVLQLLAPVVFLGGCVTGLGMTIAGNSRGGDSLSGFCLIASVTMYLAGFAMKRYVRAAEQTQQQITLQRLLNNPRFSIYAFDNATAKAIDADLRNTLMNVKDGLTVNARIAQPETFEL